MTLDIRPYLLDLVSTLVRGEKTNSQIMIIDFGIGIWRISSL